MNKFITKIILIVFIFMLIPTKIFASNFDTEKINDHTKWLKIIKMVIEFKCR